MNQHLKFIIRATLIDSYLMSFMTAIFSIFSLLGILTICFSLKSKELKKITFKYTKKEIISYLLKPFNKKINDLYFLKQIVLGIELLIVAESVLFILYLISIDIL